MKKKVVYLTQWAAKDSKKEYPHGWGFEAPIVEFDQSLDPAEVSKICREQLSNDEFDCIGATPRELIDGSFELMGIEPGPERDSEEWAIRDIDLLLDNADFDSVTKVKETKKIIKLFFDRK